MGIAKAHEISFSVMYGHFFLLVEHLTQLGTVLPPFFFVPLCS